MRVQNLRRKLLPHSWTTLSYYFYHSLKPYTPHRGPSKPKPRVRYGLNEMQAYMASHIFLEMVEKKVGKERRSEKQKEITAVASCRLTLFATE